ncbi:NDP-sugar synthase [Methanoculleus bourgensis]|jgi:mannose-1-phosphate guanylyltransferase|uniref:Bifunctional protein GlmU n=3 Tax=Methanoculleus bourgensis TaxID=83986 RepID=I7LIQ3_METBM|nr:MULTISPECIES: NDP-sugar synthase [Methanoculleus]MBT0731910.1 NDP-sugar synthase [Methanoculleus bourgensis]MDD3372512.1 NDP-sugar synthase [Methanoculleus bourgensis]NMA87787.1 NDP-sugar synthase [Methanoculleus bourgensis]NQS77522.1 NDP-sugar synthase [Methanoculleus bourgensis]CCJ35197.1 mannose-1-phosphate guanylyltransferase [Methanoculleus bourgensis MS2]
MKVCIMCGGEGTRLRPLTFGRPKPCVPIVNKPSIQHLVSHLSNLGFNDVVITLGYMSDAIEKALGDGSLFGVNVTYVREKTKLGTAGSVKNAQKYLEEQPFLVVGGDHVVDLNLLEFYREHLNNDSITTIGLISIDDPTEYGIAEIDANYQIKRFKEKPSPGEIFSNLASTGMYVCNPEVFDHIPAGEKFDFARNLFPELMEKGYTLKAWLARGNWSDVGSPRSLREAERWKLQDIRFTNISGDLYIKGARVMGPAQIGNSVSIAAHSRVIGPVSIGAGTIIEENVVIGPYTSIGEGCIIKSNAKVFSSSIYNRVVIGRDSTVSGSIIDNDTLVGTGCNIEHDTVIGPHVVLKNNVVVHSGTRVWPEVIIPEGSVVKEHVLNEDYDTRTEGS